VFPSHEGNTSIVVMRDDAAPSGSMAASPMEGNHRNMRGPIGSAGLVSSGGQRQGTARAAVRAEVGSRTGPYYL
jgi:hypothetical protein